MSARWRVRAQTIIAMTASIAAFVVFPACFLPSGTTRARPAPPPPTHGPRSERGGQRLRAPVPDDAAARARAALVARGWTPVASTRADEALGFIHDNVAVIRWSRAGWWARVDQRSAFAGAHERVPPWDHPWEALRLLHACVPDAGPAEGWSPWPESAPFDLAVAARGRCDPYTRFPIATTGEIASPRMRSPAPDERRAVPDRDALPLFAPLPAGSAPAIEPVPDDAPAVEPQRSVVPREMAPPAPPPHDGVRSAP